LSKYWGVVNTGRPLQVTYWGVATPYNPCGVGAYAIWISVEFHQYVKVNNLGQNTSTGVEDFKLFNSMQNSHIGIIGNESVPKIIFKNNTINLCFKTAISILLISDRNSFRVLFYKIVSVYFT